MKPARIQRQRTKGWQMPSGAIYVGRPTIFGNPFTIPNAVEAGYLRSADDPLARLFLTDCFLDWMTEGRSNHDGRDWWQGPESDARKAVIRRRLPELRGHDLACWCPLDQPCHADVLLALANAPEAALLPE